MVSGYKRCPNGHFYKDDLAQCPYCSSSAGAVNPNATQASPDYVGGGAPMGGATMPGGGAPAGGGMGDANKTRVMPGMGPEPGGAMGGETIPNTGAYTTPEPEMMRPAAAAPAMSASKTMIFDEGPSAGMGSGEVRSSRKLVGWLVSYTLSDMGVDFKLFEGRNVIGRDLDCQISVNDGTVSGKHCVLLYREGSYFIQDSLSTSGTRVNGADTGVNAVTLNDGDVIQVGKTVFKFRTAF